MQKSGLFNPAGTFYKLKPVVIPIAFYAVYLPKPDRVSQKNY